MVAVTFLYNLMFSFVCFMISVGFARRFKFRLSSWICWVVAGEGGSSERDMVVYVDLVP